MKIFSQSRLSATIQPCISMNFCTEFSKALVLPCETSSSRISEYRFSCSCARARLAGCVLFIKMEMLMEIGKIRQGPAPNQERKQQSSITYWIIHFQRCVTLYISIVNSSSLTLKALRAKRARTFNGRNLIPGRVPRNYRK